MRLYVCRDVCSIADPATNTVVVTGGVYTETVVSLYGEEGWVKDLPSLNQGRNYHACAAYYRDDGDRVSNIIFGWVILHSLVQILAPKPKLYIKKEC